MQDPAIRGGQKGGEAALHSEKVSAAQLAQYLKGIDFPAGKQRLIDQARKNGAPENVLSWFQKMPEKQYTRANEVEQEFGKLKWE